jgi:hypothetical protein
MIGLLTLPARQASAQVDFSGTWTLDREMSADLSKATFEPQQTQTRRASGFSGGFGGRGFGGRNGGGRSARPAPGDNTTRDGESAPTADERTRLRELADYVKGFTSIVVAHSDHSTFTVTDALGRSRLFPTDGSKTQHALATTTVESTTRWDGPHMVTAYTISPTRELVFTYTLVPATKQLVLRVRLDESGRPRADVPELRLVYKLKPAPRLSTRPPAATSFGA